MKVLIIGGTGFLGYHATKELIAKNHHVTVIGLPPAPVEGLFPSEVEIYLGNLDDMSDDQLIALFKGKDAIVFAAGADDRVTPRKPAYPFFKKYNVDSVHRVFTLAKQAGVKKGIVLGSYFAYFDRIWPELNLAKKHPYIRSRVEQSNTAFEAGDETLSMSVLELPYIFGSMPGKTPLWKPLLKYVFSPFPLFYPAGGTTCVTVQQVAQAICGAVEHGQHRQCYPIGGKNLTWVQLLETMSELEGRHKKVITLPDWLVTIGAGLISLVHRMKGLESGLNPVEFVKLQTRNTFIDNSQTRLELGYSDEDLRNALLDTIAACK
jgi:nucleoside-diphosphate-sugar epimerase